MFKSLACPCGEYVVVAEGLQRPVEGGHYGPRFMASVVTAKCADSMPLHRLEKQLKRIGLSVSRSSLCNLFHQTAEALKPIYEYMLDKMPIASASSVYNQSRLAALKVVISVGRRHEIIEVKPFLQIQSD